MAVKPIPEGYHTVTPHIICKAAAQAIDFYKKALNAREIFRMPMPDGKIGHAEIQIGNSRLMLADEFPEMGAISPKTAGGNTGSFYLYVEDCDALFKQALAAGCKELKPMADQFYGDRNGTLEDPFGHKWSIGTRKEELSPAELEKRAKAAHKG